MLLIPCPWCGPRDEHEFSYGGEAHIARPADPYAMDDAQWADYLFMRTNPKGMHLERWMHAHGCRRWFNMARDTVSHEIAAVYKPGEKPPRGIRPARVASAPATPRRGVSARAAESTADAAPATEKTVAKKTTTTKTAKKKAAGKKTTAKKTTAKKTATKKTAAKKTAAKKAATKKTAAKTTVDGPERVAADPVPAPAASGAGKPVAGTDEPAADSTAPGAAADQSPAPAAERKPEGES